MPGPGHVAPQRIRTSEGALRNSLSSILAGRAERMNPVPFEPQLSSYRHRTCGAAALAMVYSAVGLRVSQFEIWRVISAPDARGGIFARTYRFPFDAAKRGMRAIAFKAKDSIRAVAAILASGAYAIMNHRLSEESDLGHYTVALAVSDTGIASHDPQLGPFQRIGLEAMRKLWLPRSENCEIKGNFRVALAASSTPHACITCGTKIPEVARCPGCNNLFGLSPGAALGCMSAECASRLWQEILRPYCDLNFS